MEPLCYQTEPTSKQCALLHQCSMHIESSLFLFYVVAQMPSVFMHRNSNTSVLDFLSTMICPKCSQTDSIHEIQSLMSLGILSCSCSHYHAVSLLKARPAQFQWCLSLPCSGPTASEPCQGFSGLCLRLQSSSSHIQILFTNSQARREWFPTPAKCCVGAGLFPRFWDQ